MHHTAGRLFLLPSRSSSTFRGARRGAVQLAVGAQGPQERVQQHTVKQVVDLAPFVKVLHGHVLQMADQLADVHKFFDVMWPDFVQVIEVPKISVDTSRNTPRLATLSWRNSWWKCLLLCPSCCSLPSRTLTFQFPALAVSWIMEVFKVFSQRRAQQRWNQSVEQHSCSRFVCRAER